MIGAFLSTHMVKGLAVALAAATLAALWYRGEAAQAGGERDLALAQLAVLADSVQRCNVATDAVKRVGDAGVKASRDLLALARERFRPQDPAIIQRLEDLIRNPPAGADCRDAWREIELMEQNAGRSR